MFFHNERPHFSTYSKVISLFDNTMIELFLQATADQVEAFYFYSDQKIADNLLQEFAWLAKCIEGLSLQDALKLSWQDLIDYDQSGTYEQKLEKNALPIICEPIYHLEKILHEFMGITEIESVISPDDEVICYCFSVRKSEIISFLESNPQAKIYDLTNQLNVAGACQSCLGSVQDIMSSFSLSTFDYKSLDVDEIIIALEKWDVLGSYLKMGLISFGVLEGNILRLRVKNPEKFDDMAWQVEDYLRDQIGALFVVEFIEF
jgi:bacterioferritin-associated ferredoxin